MFRNHFKIAWRNIARHKLYTGIKVLGLALGICACIVIWIVTRYEFSFDNFHPDKERIYRVGSKMKIFDWYDNDLPPPVPEAMRKEISGLEAVTCFFPYWNPGITIPDKVKPARKFGSNLEGTDGMSGVIIADSEWFSIFKYDWLAGNPRSSLHDPYNVVLSESRAYKYFGKLPLEKIIGRQIVYDDSLRVNVSGIIKDWNKNTDFPYTDFISFSTINNSFLKDKRHMNDWSMAKGGGMFYWPISFVKLSKAVSASQVNAQLKALVAKHIKMDTINTFSMQLQPLTDIHFNGSYSNDDTRKAHLPTLYALMCIAIFILLLATVNFINLATAQSIQRAKEIGVRKVLGSGRVSLISQFLTETLSLTLIAVGLAVLLVKPVLFIFQDYIPNGVKFNLFNLSTILFLLAITVFTTLLAGFYPARVLAGYLPILSLKGAGEQKGTEKWWLRKSLIVFQFSISLVFIIVTLVMGKQIRFMLKADYGFKSDAIMTVTPDWKDTTGKIKVMEERIKQLPGVDKIVREGTVPIGWGMMFASVIYKGKNETEQMVSTDWGNEEFIPFYQMHLAAGRNLRHSDSLVEFVINETLAKRLGFSRPEEALGKFLYWNKKPLPVVGVVADFHEGSFRDAIKPLIIGNETRIENSLGIKLASRGNQMSNTKATIEAIEKIYKDLYPKESFYYLFMDESIASMYANEQKTAALMQASMLTTIFISCMGLFGLSLFTAVKRTKEIGIRKVLGAGVTDIVSMLSKNIVVLVILSLFIASPIAWWVMHRWLEDFAYRAPLSWWIFPLAGLGAIAIALLTVGSHAFRAALANPVESLRTE
jgi:putative ABC transport system permease protein